MYSSFCCLSCKPPSNSHIKRSGLHQLRCILLRPARSLEAQTPSLIRRFAAIHLTILQRLAHPSKLRLHAASLLLDHPLHLGFARLSCGSSALFQNSCTGPPPPSLEKNNRFDPAPRLLSPLCKRQRGVAPWGCRGDGSHRSVFTLPRGGRVRRGLGGGWGPESRRVSGGGAN